MNMTGAYELKVAKNARLNFNAVKPHQVAALRAADSGLYYKIPDVGYDQKPFDCFYMDGCIGYVVIRFNTNARGNNDFYMIDVDTWVSESEGSEKSLTEVRAMEVGSKHTLGTLG